MLKEVADFGFYGPAAIQVTCASATGYVGNSYNSSISASGGVSPYTYSISDGALPDGLSLNANTGAITGTPTKGGTFSFTVKIVDTRNNTAGTKTQNCTITIQPPPTPTCASLGNAVLNASISPLTLGAAGGVGGPYTFSASGLPAGLNLTTSGVLSGTPTVSGTFSVTITVTDSAGNTGSGACTFTIAPRPGAVCAIILNAVQGVPLVPTGLTGTGGAGGPYKFSAIGLPTGLAMDADGTISGTPSVSGTFNYTVTVTDAAGNPGTINCSVTVVPPVTSTCAVINAVQGVAITPVTLSPLRGHGHWLHLHRRRSSDRSHAHR